MKGKDIEERANWPKSLVSLTTPILKVIPLDILRKLT